MFVFISVHVGSGGIAKGLAMARQLSCGDDGRVQVSRSRAAPVVVQRALMPTAATQRASFAAWFPWIALWVSSSLASMVPLLLVSIPSQSQRWALMTGATGLPKASTVAGVKQNSMSFGFGVFWH